MKEGVPVLGICYGMQLMAQSMGGRVGRAKHREFGRAELLVQDGSDLFKGLDGKSPFSVWMSHGDRIESLPSGFKVIARTANSPIAAMKSVNKATSFLRSPVPPRSRTYDAWRTHPQKLRPSYLRGEIDLDHGVVFARFHRSNP